MSCPSSKSWDIPTSDTSGTEAYSNGTYFIKLYTPDSYKMYNESVLPGKENAYLELPKFNFDVNKIVVTGNSEASDLVKTNIYVDDNYRKKLNHNRICTTFLLWFFC